MDEEPLEAKQEKPLSFWRWLAMFYGRIIFYSLFTGAIAFFVLIPSWEGMAPRNELFDALDDAVEVRLEEYVAGKVTAVKKLSSSEFNEVREAMPFRLQPGMPGLIVFCWWPHHRVAVVRSDGSLYSFEVCFHCSMTKSVRGPGQETGPSVPHPEYMEKLHRLFTRHEIPVRFDYGDNEPPDFEDEPEPKTPDGTE